MIKAWAIMARGKILEIDNPSMLTLYLDCDEAEIELEKIEPLGWVKGRPRIVPVEIRVKKNGEKTNQHIQWKNGNKSSIKYFALNRAH